MLIAPGVPKFVEVDVARAFPGLRLVVLAGVPSMWSEAAKALFHVKGIDFVAVRARLKDDVVRGWTGVHNAPVAVYLDEPPRSHWADILALAERLSSTPPLLPTEVEVRARVLGLCHEICGDMGLMWCARLALIHASLTSDGQKGFSVKVSRYLASKYGYASDKISDARQRVQDIVSLLTQLLATNQEMGSPYLVGDALTALDIYAATATAVLAPFPEELCPMMPEVRSALLCFGDSLGFRMLPPLLEHRELVYRRHLELPIRL